ncbi:hypothetical protein CIW83_02965 [Tissierella sp. P1]|nr:hypothetical protein CIW83_02965 [Tissierella sp. P1]
MDFARQTLEYEETNYDKILILDYMINVIKLDLQYDLLTTILYSEEYFSKQVGLAFPIYYYDEQGNQFETYPDDGERRKVDLSKDCVLVLSWNRNRLRNSIKNIYKNKFEYHSSNHLAYYFTRIDVCYAYNGTHSISSGVGHKKGFIEAVECDVSKLFDHVYSDGISWYNIHNNSELTIISDFRIAILYELAKIKYNLENSN